MKITLTLEAYEGDNVADKGRAMWLVRWEDEEHYVEVADFVDNVRPEQLIQKIRPSIRELYKVTI